MAAKDRKVGDREGNSWANEEEGERHKSSLGSCDLLSERSWSTASSDSLDKKALDVLTNKWG